MVEDWDLERLGESAAFGWRLLELLEQQGWLVHVTAPFAAAIDDAGTPGVMVIAAHRDVPGAPVIVLGRTVADCATPLLVEASKWIRQIAAARETGAV